MRRKKGADKGLEVPHDYLKLFRETLDRTFGPALKDLAKFRRGPKFEVWGQLYPDEALMMVSLGFEEGTAATTLFASVDFDSKKDAKAAAMEKALSRCVDCLGDLLAMYLDRSQPEVMEQFVAESLGALENAPFDWSPIQRDGGKVFVKIDKTNLALEAEAARLLEE